MPTLTQFGQALRLRALSALFPATPTMPRGPAARPAPARGTGSPDPRRLIVSADNLVPTRMEAHSLQADIAELAATGDWSEILFRIRVQDQARQRTQGLKRLAELSAFAARRAVMRPVAAGAPGLFGTSILMARRNLARLEQMLMPHRGDYVAAVILAQSAMDIAAACRGQNRRPEIAEPPAGRAASALLAEAAEQTARAQAWLSPFDAVAENAPLLAGARYRLLDGIDHPHRHLRDWFGIWNDLDPANPFALSSHALNLLPYRLGSAQDIEVAARQAALHSAASLGHGGYALVYCDEVFAADPGLVAQVDPAFYLDAVADILRRHPFQPLVNHYAAALLRLAEGNERLARQYAPATEAAEMFRDGFAMIVRRHLHHLHPCIWDKPEPEIRRAIAGAFADEIGQGATVRLTEGGPVVSAC